MSADDKELSESLRRYRFNSGDKVRCIKTDNSYLQRGIIYEVDYANDDMVFLKGGGGEDFFAWRFELAPPESATNAPDLAAAELEKIGRVLDVLCWDEEKTTLEKVRALVLNEVHEAFDQGVARLEAIK